FSNIKVKNKKKRNSNDETESEDSEEDNFEDLDDEEVSLSSMDEDFGEDIDEEGGTFMDVSDDDNTPGKTKIPIKRKRKLKDTGVAAAAEEFGHLLDENIGSKFDNIGMNAMANKDNANLKQLKWEAERDKWIHNRDVKSIIRQKKKFRQKPLKNKQKYKRKK
uniref:Uncharacterized protein n=1 Tax=Laticauda laticaudata TaxID=8630 RepID=A0A8C5WTY4_LATLA